MACAKNFSLINRLNFAAILEIKLVITLEPTALALFTNASIPTFKPVAETFFKAVLNAILVE